MTKQSISFVCGAVATLMLPPPEAKAQLLCTVGGLVSGINTSGNCGTDSLVNGNYDFATGYVSKVTGNNSAAYGAFSFAGGDNAVAIGARSTASNTAPYNGASNATALGAYSTAGVGGTATGMGSTASGIDAIAYGHSATADQSLAMAVGFSSQARAANAVAIGPNASALAAGSVALGSGSVADVANTVSIGSVGNERRLVNVSDGIVSPLSRDAVNGSQLNAVNNVVGTNTTAITALNNGLATTNANAALAGARIANALGGGSVSDGNNAPTAPNYALFGTNYSNVGTALGAIETRTISNATNLTTLSTQIVSGAIGLVQQATPTGSISIAASTAGGTIDIGGTSGSRRISGLSAGALSNTSTDAVNGAQLSTTNGNVAGNTANIASNTAAIASTATSVATNLSNLTLTNQRIASALGGGSSIDGNNIVTAPTYNLFGTPHTNVGSALGAIETRTISNADNIANLSTQMSSGAIGLVRQATPAGAITVASLTGGSNVDFTGTSGARRLIGLSAGMLSSTSTDAVTGAQLNATNVNVTTNATNLTTLSAQISSGSTGLVQQATPTSTITVASMTGGSNVDFTGTSGARRLTGLSAGTLSNTSTDAVTGAQLNATNASVATNAANIGTTAASLATNVATFTQTNQQIAAAFGGGAAIDANGGLTAPRYTLFGTNYANVGTAFGAVESRTNANTTAITNLSTQMQSGTGGLVQQDQTSRTITVAAANDGTLVDVSGTSGNRRITGLSAGTLSSTSTDAVTGAQLNATNTSLATTTSGLMAANNLIAQTVTNAATTNQRLAAAFGGGSALDANGVFTAPNYSLFGTTYSSLGSALGAIESRTSTNTTQISSIWSRIGQANLSLLQQDATTNDISLGSQTAGSNVSIAGTSGNRRLTGLGNGMIAAGSSDAVTGSQLNDTNALVGSLSSSLPSLMSAVSTIQSNFSTGQQRIAAAFGGGSTLDGNGLATAPSYSILGAAYSSVGNALAALNSRVQTNSAAISTLQAGSGSGSGGLGLVVQDPASRTIQVASTTDGATLNVSGASGSRVVTGVAPGQVSTTSTDAINGAQLNTTNNALATLANTSTRTITAVADRANSTAAALAGAIGGGVTVDANGNVSVPQFMVQNSAHTNVASAFGALDRATSSNSTAVQNLVVSVNNLADKNRFVSVNGRGTSALSSGAQSIALGSNAASSGEEAVSIGADSVASATGAIAVGSLSAATGRNAIAIGVNSLATGSVALGVNTRASNGGAALGDDSIATGSDSAALGPKATATAANSVAIGSGSVANVANVVSVGSSGNERRITNVATGIERTDAANVGQLQDFRSSVTGQLNEFNQRISNVTGGVAMAMAMSGGSLPDNKAVGFAVNVGAFGGQTAIGISQYLRVNNNIVLSAGMGIQQNQVGGRAGMMVAW